MTTELFENKNEKEATGRRDGLHHDADAGISKSNFCHRRE